MVRVVTDSCSDITSKMAEQFGLTVIPLNVHFGDKVYRDNIDLNTEGFYQKLTRSKIIPTTSIPSLAVFTDTLNNLAKETRDILVITLSRKFSAVYDIASKSKEALKSKCNIEVIDSQVGIGGQLILAVSAAFMARAEATLEEIANWVTSAIPRTHVLMTFDTLEYLRRGGRIGKAQAFLGTLLKVNPILGIKEGEAFPITRVRSRALAVDFLVNFVENFKKIDALVIEDAITTNELGKLAQRLEGLAPDGHFYRSKVSPVVGAHVGPHVLSVSVLEGE
jgi:DegV family protein with EDD domain